MTPLSVIVITKNEADNICDCLESVQWADDIIVVDAESKDSTVHNARKFTSNVFVKTWLGYAATKQFAVSQTQHAWVLWLDADERVLPELAIEIQKLIATHPQQAAFSVARRAYFLGRWIKHSGWYPGRVARLFHKERAKFNSAEIHEGLEINGDMGMLKNDLLHFTDPNIYHYFSKFNRYTSLAANELAAKRQAINRSDLFIRPCWMFIKMYFIRFGFLDGIQGLLLALFSSAYVFSKYAKLWERQFVKINKN